METIMVSKDSNLMKMIRKAKERKQAWEKSVKGELEKMQAELAANKSAVN